MIMSNSKSCYKNSKNDFMYSFDLAKRFKKLKIFS